MGETATRHATERRIPDAGKQEKNRKGIPVRKQETGLRTLFFAS